ncbi:MAG: sugar phosphate isomerase/epimerase [Eubacteriales bacterium]|nr:sugar phosphate isomerase/epimerase [Eubacteriales bacterium]
MKLGVITDCLKQPVREAVLTAKSLGMTGVQIYATKGSFSPESLDAAARADLCAFLKENGMEISALCGDMGGYGFEREADNALRVEKTKAIIDLAVDLGTAVVTTHIGVIPAEDTNPRFAVMQQALTECGRYAKSRGVTLAIETGPETAPTLLHFLEGTDGGVGVNLDPANFVMVSGQDPADAVDLLGKYIVHTHLKDGKKLNDDMTPEQIYHGFAVGGVEALNACKSFAELPIGEGDVPWDRYLAALERVGYNGYLTIEREAGDQPLEDIRGAVGFIRKKVRFD